MSKNKDAAAIPAILDYLNKQNRPYSAIDIFNNLHGEFGKTAVVKALESLAADGKIKSKSYNKQTVYVADQAKFPDVDDAEMKTMDAKIASLTQKLKKSSDDCRQSESVLASLNSAITTEEAQTQLVHINKQCVEYTARLTALKSHANSVSPKERQLILQARTTNVKEWRKRKRMAMDILNAVLEGYPKSKKELFEEIGIDTDEDHGVKPPDV